MAASSLLSSFVFVFTLACCGLADATQNQTALYPQNQTSIIPAQIDQTTHEGCIHLPVIHSTNLSYFSKRGVQLQLANRSDVAYYAQLSIGTPPQPVFVQLDTGSFELWVNPDCSTVTGSDAAFCQRVGQYDSTKSSTQSSLGTTKTLRYGIGSANISYVTDNISLAGSTTTLQDVQFGVATSSEDAFSGILGIGYGKDIATRYLNFIDQLALQNATRVKAYTLALGSKDTEEGVIVFGGVDTSKFGGGLAKLPIIPAANAPDRVARFWVDMESVSITPPNKQTTTFNDSSMPVFLDSGSTMTLLPAALAALIAADFGAPTLDPNGFYRVDCALTDVNGTLDFAFDGVTVQVPYSELIREVPSSPPSCFLGISPSSSFTLLGDTFLRSAYAVFDLESNAIWMAQAANCGSTPAVLNNVDDLASLTGACAPPAAKSGDASGSGKSSPSVGTDSSINASTAVGLVTRTANAGSPTATRTAAVTSKAAPMTAGAGSMFGGPSLEMVGGVGIGAVLMIGNFI
ncbi:aspartic peptidase domain-containing protein [Podospora appendiculata]|uniref:Aspartic peptidase domain-containing protein n=1 Tax=Podospora appendiculata TaxID=314037 RepID=A0AAE1C734_9PEZI|nr:aspartic peptidase domain-containing protein [Podospora appendiculata]